jgi:hypothetical protein
VVAVFLLWVVFYPLYVRRRVAWGARRWLRYVLPASLLCASLSTIHDFVWDHDHMFVRCGGAGSSLASGFVCSVRHQGGTRGREACWDIVATCANGPGGRAHACATVNAGERLEKSVPISEFDSYGSCDWLTNVEAVNIVVSP